MNVYFILYALYDFSLFIYNLSSFVILKSLLDTPGITAIIYSASHIKRKLLIRVYPKGKFKRYR